MPVGTEHPGAPVYRFRPNSLSEADRSDLPIQYNGRALGTNSSLTARRARLDFTRPAEALLVCENLTRTVVGLAATAVLVNIRLFRRYVGRDGPDLI
jgi:hypothetical protein